MVKIPEAHISAAKRKLTKDALKNMLDPQDKINKIEAIAKFFAKSTEEESDDLKTKTYFKYYNIGIRNDDLDLESLK